MSKLSCSCINGHKREKGKGKRGRSGHKHEKGKGKRGRSGHKREEDKIRRALIITNVKKAK